MRNVSLHVYALLATLLVLGAPGRADAQILGLTEFAVDLTNAPDALAKIRWEDTDRFGLSKNGLGRSNTPTGGRDITLQTTQPIALGTWWRPTDNARIQATVTWAGEHAGAMPGSLFVSYSCDAASWSDWQHVTESRAKKTKTTRIHNTTLQVPRATREWYWRQLRQYAKQDVPWDSDEEAFVTWYRERHPQAFTKTRPFLGYLRFQYETAVPHGTYITGLEVDVTWAVSGISTIPKTKASEALQRERQDGAWSWKADGSHLDPKDFDRRAATKAVYEAVLRRMLAAEREQDAKKDPMERLLLLADTGTPLSGVDLEFLERPTRREGAQGARKAPIEPEGVEEAHHAAFGGVHRLRAWVPADLDVGLPITRVGTSWLTTFLKEGRPDGWSALRKRFGNSRGWCQLSSAVFDAKRARALVTVGRQVGFLHGAGETI
ncbi:MAG: hypothetical protein P1V36_13340, partial [Planctomycetota bacterium]|nr:hypothetical protein [Planctomycetota bacterium]